MYKYLFLASQKNTEKIYNVITNDKFLLHQDTSINSLYKKNDGFIDAVCNEKYQWIIIDLLNEINFLEESVDSDQHFDLFCKSWSRFYEHLSFLGISHRIKIVSPNLLYIKEKKYHKIIKKIYAFLQQELSEFNFIDNYEMLESLDDIPYFDNTLSHYDPYKLNLPVFTYKNLNTFLKQLQGSNGIHRIQIKNGYYLDILLNNFHLLEQKTFKKHTLLVGLNAAVSERSKKTAPFFSGVGISNKLNMPLIAISDISISMYKNLQLGWYAGNKDVQDFQYIIKELLEGLAKRYKSELLLFGGSGAGFAALVQASLLRCKAKIVVFNPQTNIDKYMKSAVDNYIKCAFSVVDSESKNEIFLNKIISSITLKNIKSNIELLYLQNMSDVHHIKHHAQSFFIEQVLQGKRLQVFKDGQIVLYYGDWGDGHTAPNSSLIYSILDRAVSGDSFEKICKNLCEDVDEIIDLTEAPSYDLSKVTGADIDRLIHVEYSYDSEKEELIVNTDIDKKLKLGIAYYLYDKNNVVIDKSKYSLSGDYVFKDIKRNEISTLKVFLRDMNYFKITKKIKLF